MLDPDTRCGCRWSGRASSVRHLDISTRDYNNRPDAHGHRTGTGRYDGHPDRCTAGARRSFSAVPAGRCIGHERRPRCSRGTGRPSPGRAAARQRRRRGRPDADTGRARRPVGGRRTEAGHPPRTVPGVATLVGELPALTADPRPRASSVACLGLIASGPGAVRHDEFGTAPGLLEPVHRHGQTGHDPAHRHTLVGIGDPGHQFAGGRVDR